MKRKSVRVLVAVFAVVIILVLAAMIRLHIKTDRINNDYSSVFSNEKYLSPVSVEGVEAITQDVSCGYAVIEMFSSWSHGDITEEKLYADYGKVVTSTGSKFCEEMNRQFPMYHTSVRKWMTNTELIDIIHSTLSKGIPVPIEWAALYGDEWTLHYSLVTAVDIPNNMIMIANPYGYYEELTIDEFISRTTFEAYENMPVFLKLGFAFGIFEKNTVFIPEYAL